jgi:hypothetical protein
MAMSDLENVEGTEHLIGRILDSFEFDEDESELVFNFEGKLLRIYIAEDYEGNVSLGIEANRSVN